VPGFNYDPKTKAPFSNTAEFGGTMMSPKTGKPSRTRKMPDEQMKMLKTALQKRKMEREGMTKMERENGR
jgi:hypothetical protein